MSLRFPVDGLIDFGVAILRAAGLPEVPARAVAEGLVDGDLLGHTTHGLALLPGYAGELVSGAMEREGGPLRIAGFGAVETWDGRRLPGVWLTKQALETAVAHAANCGLGAVAIRRSHHIACLATFLEQPARQGYVILVFSSDPGSATVAPFGGMRGVLSPNPVAVGIPASPDPVLIDISTSITTNGLCARLREEGARLPHPWLLTREGQPTGDPAVLETGGTILPVGGLDHGHKGFALSLLVEALTQGLSGYGRADMPKDWGASVLVLALAPQAFGSPKEFQRQIGWTLAACRDSAPRPGQTVRVPGELALARKREAIEQGAELHPKVIEAIGAVASRFGVPPPRSS